MSTLTCNIQSNEDSGGLGNETAEYVNNYSGTLVTLRCFPAVQTLHYCDLRYLGQRFTVTP